MILTPLEIVVLSSILCDEIMDTKNHLAELNGADLPGSEDDIARYSTGGFLDVLTNLEDKLKADAAELGSETMELCSWSTPEDDPVPPINVKQASHSQDDPAERSTYDYVVECANLFADILEQVIGLLCDRGELSKDDLVPLILRGCGMPVDYIADKAGMTAEEAVWRVNRSVRLIADRLALEKMIIGEGDDE